MPLIHVYRHVPHEHLGGAARLLEAEGISYRYVNLYETAPEQIPPIEQSQGLIVLGGPMSVNDPAFPTVEVELQRVRTALRSGLPYLGICLGSQLLAKAVGGRIFANPRGREIGWYPIQTTPEAAQDRLLGHFEAAPTVLHWHGEIFALPDEAVVLAKSEITPIQAFRWGERAWGLLFHVELDDATLAEWLETPSMRSEAQGERAGRVDEIRAQASERLSVLSRLRQGAFRQFCKEVKS